MVIFLTNGILPFLFLFFPKCPLCWAAYLSALDLTGIPWLKYHPDLIWIFVLLSVINLVFMFKKAKNIGNYMPVLLALTGYSVLFPAILLNAPQILVYVSIGLITVSAFMSVFKFRNLQERFI